MRWLVLWWGVVMSSGCAPVFVANEYVALGEVVPGADGCSWSYVGGGMAVTALHCVEKIDPALILEKTWDAALIALDPMKLELPDVPTCDQTGDVGWMSIVCYADHRGEPNCGHVLWSNGDSITFAAETRFVRPGDSGAPLWTRDGDLVGVVVEGKDSPGFGLAARVPASWME